MAILKNIEGSWFKLVPNKPAAAFGDSGPKWEFAATARTREQADEWKAMGISVKPAEDNGKIVWKARFQRQTYKRAKDGAEPEPNVPVEVVSGQMIPLDPALIGNGSIVNIIVFQYDYEIKSKDGKGSKKGKGTMLKKVQVVKLVRYTPTEDEDFEQAEYTEVEPEDSPGDGNGQSSGAPSGNNDGDAANADF